MCHSIFHWFCFWHCSFTQILGTLVTILPANIESTDSTTRSKVNRKVSDICLKDIQRSSTNLWHSSQGQWHLKDMWKASEGHQTKTTKQCHWQYWGSCKLYNFEKYATSSQRSAIKLKSCKIVNICISLIIEMYLPSPWNPQSRCQSQVQRHAQGWSCMSFSFWASQDFPSRTLLVLQISSLQSFTLPEWMIRSKWREQGQYQSSSNSSDLISRLDQLFMSHDRTWDNTSHAIIQVMW